MDVKFILRTVRCLACRLPSAGRGLVSTTVQQLTRPSSARAFTAATPPLSAPSPSVPTATPLLSPVSSGAIGTGSLGTRTSTVMSPLAKAPSTCHPSLLSVAVPSLTPTRGRAEIYYRPSAWKRVNKHGIERRLMTPGGVEVLWRRKLKKRHSLTPFDRILPGTYNGQILPKHHLKYNQQLVSRQVRQRMKQALAKK